MTAELQGGDFGAYRASRSRLLGALRFGIRAQRRRKQVSLLPCFEGTQVEHRTHQVFLHSLMSTVETIEVAFLRRRRRPNMMENFPSLDRCCREHRRCVL